MNNIHRNNMGGILPHEPALPPPHRVAGKFARLRELVARTEDVAQKSEIPLKEASVLASKALSQAEKALASFDAGMVRLSGLRQVAHSSVGPNHFSLHPCLAELDGWMDRLKELEESPEDESLVA